MGERDIIQAQIMSGLETMRTRIRTNARKWTMPDLLQRVAALDLTPAQIDAIASVTHEANRAYSRTLGDFSHEPWPDAPHWQRESARAGVIAKLENPELTPEQSHEGWLEHKRLDGWTYGKVKDPAQKQHPCFVPYDELPVEQRRKDALFTAIVSALDPRKA